MDLYSRLPAFVRRFSKRTLIIASIAIAALLLIIVRHVLTTSSAATTDQTSQQTPVELSSVGSLSAQAGPLVVVGTVKSQSQATILAQTAGEIVSLNRSIGDRVTAGQVIGQFENSSQRAAVTQATGAYEAAQAALAKAEGTTAVNSGITSSQASNAATNAATALAAALTSAYATLDDSIHNKTDALFLNPRTQNPQLLQFTIPDAQLVINVNAERLAINDIFPDAEAAADPASTRDLDARTSAMLADARRANAFLADVVNAMNTAVPNSNYTSATIAADQASVTAARSAVVGVISSLTTAKSAYDAALAGAQTASNTATAGTQSDIAAAKANLKSAQGTLAAANASLEKTIIRSPISGTIVSLPVTQGDYVTTYSPVAIVSNPGALYVDAQVTSDDAQTIAVGNAATVEGTVAGTITFVAPALDPSTGKIEVKVGLTGDQGSLTDGEAVSLSLTRNKVAQTTTGTMITIPIVAVKITPDGPVVFTLSTSSALVAQPITLGAILGNRVIISGISTDTQIITDARGHSAGETVVVATSSAPSL